MKFLFILVFWQKFFFIITFWPLNGTEMPWMPSLRRKICSRPAITVCLGLSWSHLPVLSSMMQVTIGGFTTRLDVYPSAADNPACWFSIPLLVTQLQLLHLMGLVFFLQLLKCTFVSFMTLPGTQRSIHWKMLLCKNRAELIRKNKKQRDKQERRIVNWSLAQYTVIFAVMKVSS